MIVPYSGANHGDQDWRGGWSRGRRPARLTRPGPERPRSPSSPSPPSPPPSRRHPARSVLRPRWVVRAWPGCRSRPCRPDGAGHQSPGCRAGAAPAVRGSGQVDEVERVKCRMRSTSWTIASTSSGSRPPPRPPLERPGSRSNTTPSPAATARAARTPASGRSAAAPRLRPHRPVPPCPSRRAAPSPRLAAPQSPTSGSARSAPRARPPLPLPSGSPRRAHDYGQLDLSAGNFGASGEFTVPCTQ